MSDAIVSRRLCLLGLGAMTLPVSVPVWAQGRPALSTAINRAGRMRALSQRLSKAYAQGALGVMPERAQDWSQATQKHMSSGLEALAQATTSADTKPLLLALEKDTHGLVSQVNTAPSKAGLPAVVRAADQMLDTADRLTKAFEAQAGQGTAKIVNLAGRQRMLSQRMARAYFLSAVGQDVGMGQQQLEQSRSEFKTALDQLKAAPITTAAIRNELDLARGQWLFYETALNKTPSVDALQTVATTSERIYEVMDNLTSLYDAAIKDLLG
jgi:nitrate/nitrite-specific signal transduction histidine kinase